MVFAEMPVSALASLPVSPWAPRSAFMFLAKFSLE